MTQTVIISGPRAHEVAHELVKVAPLDHSVTVAPPKTKRTPNQNRTLHMWFGEIAQQRDDWDASEVKGFCHRQWGLPIKLRDEQFAWVWSQSGQRLGYERQCALLASGVLNVSSSMTTKELKEYMDAMQRHFLGEGVRLTNPDREAVG